MSKLKLIVSPAALCGWAILLCIGFSVVASNASRTITLKDGTKFAFAQVAFPITMHRWDDDLFVRLKDRAATEMSEFLKGAEAEAAERPAAGGSEWKPYEQSVRYNEQFRSGTFVSYIEITTVSTATLSQAITYRTVNFDKIHKREIALGDLLDAAGEHSSAIEALAGYARADIKDRTGEETESEELLEITKGDLGTYERFTLCPSTKLGKAAGLTIHFAPQSQGPYAGVDFHITVPYTVFARYLKPGMRPIFSGEPRQAPVGTDDLD